MAIRSALPWPWRAVLAVALLAFVAGMWWWGFDFGQIFGGFNRKELATRLATLEAEVSRLRDEGAGLRTRASQLESELAMARGTQSTLTKQAVELQNENSQLKEDLVFLQQLFADTNKQAGLSIQRVVVEKERDLTYRYSLLLVRGGKPKDDFEGHVTLQVQLQSSDGGNHPQALSLPDEQTRSTNTLKLKFKYYQRIEGSFDVPEGTAVRAVVARAFESGQPAPRATRGVQM